MFHFAPTYYATFASDLKTDVSAKFGMDTGFLTPNIALLSFYEILQKHIFLIGFNLNNSMDNQS